MSRCSDRGVALVLFAVWLLGGVALAAAAQAPAGKPPAAPRQPFGFGKPATPAEIAGWDIDVRPDGTGLPPGKGTVAQGQLIYDEKCASCHGTFGESTDYLPLAGGVGSLASSQPVRTTGSKLNYATTLFDYIRRAMPFDNPQTLGADEVYALTAYVLHLNDILPADAALDRESLPGLRLPNRDGFTTDHGLSQRSGKPDTRNVGCMANCVAEVRLSSQMPEYARDSHGNLAEQTRLLGAVEGVNTGAAAGASVPTVGRVSTAAQPTPGDIARKSGCLACHAVDRRILGPSFREVGARYVGSSEAEGRLVAKVKTGGGGVWGAIPMPGQPQVKDADARAVVNWILLGAK